MLTSKQRAKLRGMANGYETIFQIGKNGIGAELTGQIDSALKAREMIKCRVLETCEYSAREAAQKLAEATDSEPVQVIGTRFVLFRRNKDKDKRVIELDD